MDESEKVSSDKNDGVCIGDTSEQLLSSGLKRKNSDGNNTDENNGLLGKEKIESPSCDDAANNTTIENVTQEESSPIEKDENDEGEEVDLRVIYNKVPIPIKISLNKTVGDLKRMIEKSTQIAPELQKVLVRGIPKDDVVLKSLGLIQGSKVLVIGTPLSDVLAINKLPTPSELKGTDESESESGSSNWCSLPRHSKIIEKGVPDDVMGGIIDVDDPLPHIPLSGMLNSKGGKLRLTFKLEANELWIGSKERTDKIPINSIRNVTSQPIIGYEHYHILAIQTGTTEASRIFIYWVPAQYIAAIKDALED